MKLCKKHATNVLQASAKQINAAVLELELSVQNSAIVKNAIIKVTCIWMVMKLRMKIMIAKVAEKMNNLLDMIRLFVVLIYLIMPSILIAYIYTLHFKYVYTAFDFFV